MVINVKKELLRFLAEDAHSYDITSALLPNQKINAQIISRDDGIIAGIKFAKDIFKLKGIHSKSFKKDGSKVRANQKILQIYFEKSSKTFWFSFLFRNIIFTN